jgi:hypothetical protein
MNESHSPDPTGDRKYPQIENETQLEATDMVHKITVQLADMNGHSELLMTPAETVEMVQQNTSSWIFADNKMVPADQVNEENLSSVVNVRILPGLVGG